LVSIVRYNKTLTSQNRTVPHYAAFVLTPNDAGPTLVRLGAASAIDGAIAAWRRQAALGQFSGVSQVDAEMAYRTAGARLRKVIWDPLTPYLTNTTRVLVVPDGALNLVNFAALPVGSTEFLVDRPPVVHYLAAERDLVGHGDDAPVTSGVLVLGGPAFDDGSVFAPAPKSTSRLRGVPASCGTLQTLTFENLPATLREATEIAGLWRTTAGLPNAEIRLAVAAQATERAFKLQAPGRRVLHLATHGFFLGTNCAPGVPGTRAIGGLTSARSNSSAALNTENPLLLSGLAFAGANQRARAKPDEDDGILTAEEIAGMNLEGTEWAVLSACDTGLGEVKAGEGVFGLRRAFQVAGVRTVIMSLWSVEDEATRQWMRALYRARLTDHLDTAESVRVASLRVLRDRRAKHLRTHPFYWAAFVASGDWR
jgi:CHAT domain-containing protein